MTPARLTAQEKAALVRRHIDDGMALTHLAEHAGVPVRTLHRWAASYRADGNVASLQRKTRSDRGHRGIADDLVAAVEALALRRPAPAAAFVYRRVGDLARGRGLDAPSYSTVRGIIARIDPGLRTLALGGDAAYRDRFELVYRRSAARPNEQWQADHTLLDVQILDSHARPARPWLTVILDDYSRAVAGYTVFFGAPTAERTALALHQAISRKTHPAWPVQGLPDVLYSDHGSDFTSNRLERVWLDTHIRLIHSRVGVPQGRGKIERLFGTITTELLPHLPGHIPHGTAGNPVTAPQLTLAQLDNALERFIVADYHRRPHSETGQAPAPALARWRMDPARPGPPRRPGHAASHRRHRPHRATRRNPVQQHPLRQPRARRVRRRDRDHPTRPARRRRGTRLPLQPLPLPRDRPRARHGVDHARATAGRPHHPPPGTQTAAT